MPGILAIGIIAVILAVGWLLGARHRRRKQEKRLKEQWGQPVDTARLDADALEDVARYWRESTAQGASTTAQGASSADQSTSTTAENLRSYVDDITWNDLELDTVFRYMNRTQSNVGEELLYAALRDTGVTDETLACRGRWMEALQKDEAGRVGMQRTLGRLGKERYHWVYTLLFHPEHKIPAHGWVYYGLALLSIAFLVAGLFVPRLLLGLMVCFGVNSLVFMRLNTTWMVELYGVRHLAAVLNCARLMQKHPVAGMEDAARELEGLCAELKPIARWNALLAMQKVNDFDFITDYIRITFQLDMISLIRLTAFVQQKQQLVCRLYALVGELDAAIAIASVRASLPGYVLPEFRPALKVEAQGLIHPMVKDPVLNTLLWDKNALVTGSNASGKSTFIKALALNAIFAQTICTCWAQRFVMPRANVMSSMALRDDVQGGDSYFIVEIKSLRRILSTLNEQRPTLCFVDEILRGTNTVERIATSTSLLTYLDGKNALCIAATHDIELTELLKDSYRQYHFREEITPAGMVFSYKLMDGPCRTRNAIRLLEQMDFPKGIIASADQMAAAFAATGQWEHHGQEG